MNTKLFSHNKGSQIISSQKIDTIVIILGKIQKPPGKYFSTILRDEILIQLRHHGWSDEVRISTQRNITITAKNGIVGLCLQTGNMARFYADLLKLQSQYLDQKIESAIYIIPLKSAAKQMGDNIANFERMTEELENIFYKVITIPIVVIGFYFDESVQ